MRDAGEWISSQAGERLVAALAGHRLTLRASELCPGESDPEDVEWELGGETSGGAEFSWTPTSPGLYRLLLRCKGRPARTATLKVGIRPRDLAGERGSLGCFLCLLSAGRGRVVAQPLPEARAGRRRRVGRARPDDRRHAVFAEAMRGQAALFRANAGVLSALRTGDLPSGLYAVFPEKLVYLGANGRVGTALGAMRRLADLPVGAAVEQAALRDALATFDPAAFAFPATDLYPDGSLAQPGRTSAGDRVARTLTDLRALAAGMGLELRSDDVGIVCDLDSGRGAVRLRAFDDAGGTRQVETLFGGLRLRDKSVFGPFGGGELVGPRGPAPKEEESDAGDGAPDGGADGGTDGGSAEEEEDRALLLFQLDEEMRNAAGTGKPANSDDEAPAPTDAEIEWVIFVHGGGLESHSDPDAGDGDGTADREGQPPTGRGTELLDPVGPPFFYEWAPAPDENRLYGLDPDLIYVTPEGSEAGGELPYPATGGGSGVLGATPSLVKTSSFHGPVLVEAFSGVDARGRQVDGAFAAVGIFPLHGDP